MGEWIAALPVEQKNRFIEDVVAGNRPSAASHLKRRYDTESKPEGGAAEEQKITVGQLRRRALDVSRRRKEVERAKREKLRLKREAEAAAERERHISTLTKDEVGNWRRVEELVASKQSKAYEDAVKTMTVLREVALRKNALTQFAQRVQTLREAHRSKYSFVGRLQKAKLLEP